MSEGSQPASLLAYRLPHSLGQKVMLESLAVVIASDQGALPVSFSGMVTVTGSVIVTQPTGTNLHVVLDSGTTVVTQPTGTNLHTVIDSGTTTVTQATGTNLHTVVDKVDLAASSPGPASVGVASAAVLAANAARKGAVIVNTSTGGQRVSLGLDGAAAVLDSGITLWPGDSWVMDDYTFTNGAIAGIASAAAATAAVQEFS